MQVSRGKEKKIRKGGGEETEGERERERERDAWWLDGGRSGALGLLTISRGNEGGRKDSLDNLLAHAPLKENPYSDVNEIL